MIKNYKAVIFDMDGTLLDSMWVWPTLDRQFFENEKLDMPDNLLEEIQGLSMHEIAVYYLEHFPLDYSVEELIQIWNDMANEHYANNVTYKKGALSFLKHLKKNHYKLGIATSNSRELVDICDRRLLFTEYIDEMVTSGEVKKGKPHPDIYLKVAHKLGVRPEECLVFEDIPGGLLAAKRAGMDTCAVADEFSNHLKKEKQQMATYFIESFEELLA
ncbi:MAG: HAD family phosphatase [Lachnospiraceae bacterium]|nr:HAD family phosphatase [Lachnospiraceae bacterium]